MREVKTSLLSILCVFAATAAMAAPAVRTIGGTGTYDSAASAANATAAARAGSLRATGGFVRPTATVSGSTLTTATTTTTNATAAAPTTGGSVSAGGGTVGRVASSPRLSIGKYIGAPKSVSSSGGGASSDLTGRVEKLESDVETLGDDVDRLDNEKQDVLQDSTYITIAGDELILDLERIKEDLEIESGTDGREIEMGTNDDGLLWRYVGEGDDAWRTLITWDDISEKLDFDGIDDTITERVTELRTEILAELDKKVDKDQGTGENGELIGRAMVVGADGILAPTGDFVTRDQGTENEGKAMVVGSDGKLYPADVSVDVSSKLDRDQGTDNAGKVMVVDDNGMVVPSDVEYATTDDMDNLGDLAYQDSVSAGQIEDGAVTTATLAAKAVERTKLAEDITKTLSGVEFWETWWNDHKDELDSGDYLVAVSQNTSAANPPQLFRVITADEDVGPAPTPPVIDPDNP